MTPCGMRARAHLRKGHPERGEGSAFQSSVAPTRKCLTGAAIHCLSRITRITARKRRGCKSVDDLFQKVVDAFCLVRAVSAGVRPCPRQAMDGCDARSFLVGAKEAFLGSAGRATVDPWSLCSSG